MLQGTAAWEEEEGRKEYSGRKGGEGSDWAHVGEGIEQKE